MSGPEAYLDFNQKIGGYDIAAAQTRKKTWRRLAQTSFFWHYAIALGNSQKIKAEEGYSMCYEIDSHQNSVAGDSTPNIHFGGACIICNTSFLSKAGYGFPRPHHTTDLNANCEISRHADRISLEEFLMAFITRLRSKRGVYGQGQQILTLQSTLLVLSALLGVQKPLATPKNVSSLRRRPCSQGQSFSRFSLCQCLEFLIVGTAPHRKNRWTLGTQNMGYATVNASPEAGFCFWV